MAADGIVLRPRLYSWVMTVPAMAFGAIGLSGLVVSADEVGGMGGRIFSGAMATLSTLLIVRLIRLRIVVGDVGISLHRIQNTRKFSWSEINSTSIVDAGEVLPWRIPVLSLKNGKTLRLDEYRSLRRDPSLSIAESVVRLLVDKRANYYGHG